MRGRADSHIPYRELLAARLDRPLTRVESRTLSAHLKQCRNCQRAEADYRAQRDLLRALPQPIPPRDMWARTSAALDREVARGVRGSWKRHVRRARRHAQPVGGLMTVVAAMGVVTVLTVFQLAPAFVPATGAPVRPTPFAVNPQPLAFIGVGPGDIAIYRTVVRQVCPPTVPIDCVATEVIERTPLGASLPAGLQAGNIALSPSGKQLALVGRNLGSDVIAVVWMPSDRVTSSPNPTESVGLVEPTENPETPDLSTATPATEKPTPQASIEPGGSPSPDDTPAPAITIDPPSGTPDPSTPPPSAAPTPEAPASPPSSAVPGLAVLNILEGVRSAGAPPAWSRNGELLAFSAMPVDGSHGPDVYIWSPSDTRARAVTSDHGSFFASWSGNRLVVSRATGDATSRTVVIDPISLEEREVAGPQIWLPAVSLDRTRAVVWSGDLVIDEGLPEPRSGALYVLDWTLVDPFRPTSDGFDDEGDALSPRPTDAGSVTPTDNSAEPVALVPLEADRDPGSAPVVDWVARWSADSQVLGVWIADSEGSPWGRLTVLAVDPETDRVKGDEALLETTMARRGFSLSGDRVAWVAPSDGNLDGELRIRAWTGDGFGGLRVVSPDQEGVLPAL